MPDKKFHDILAYFIDIVMFHMHKNSHDIMMLLTLQEFPRVGCQKSFHDIAMFHT